MRGSSSSPVQVKCWYGMYCDRESNCADSADAAAAAATATHVRYQWGAIMSPQHDA